ncbi:MAG: exo-alpha-sialidase [Caldilineaceae bacterium]|nr:exo-alpha-sialidase [Caldilineaceae bacterium]
MQIEHIFSDERPFASCHASSLIERDDGGFLVVWFGGSRESADDVAIWSAQRGVTGGWSAPRLVAKAEESAHWNPVIFRAEEGGVHLWFKVGPQIPAWRTYTAVSWDGGRSWSDPAPLVPGDAGGRGPVKNKPILLADGAWLAGASLETRTHWDAFVDRSEDSGVTWQATPLIPLDRTRCGGKGVIQPTLWESAPGQVHMLLRSTCGRVCRSDSADGGRSWSEIVPTDLPNNNSGLDVARMADGRLALICNPVEDRARTPLSVLISADNGQSWPERIDLETEPGEYSYPAIIPTAAGGLAATYTWRRERIAWVKVL